MSPQEIKEMQEFIYSCEGEVMFQSSAGLNIDAQRKLVKIASELIDQVRNDHL